MSLFQRLSGFRRICWVRRYLAFGLDERSLGETEEQERSGDLRTDDDHAADKYDEPVAGGQNLVRLLQAHRHREKGREKQGRPDQDQTGAEEDPLKPIHGSKLGFEPYEPLEFEKPHTPPEEEAEDGDKGVHGTRILCSCSAGGTVRFR